MCQSGTPHANLWVISLGAHALSRGCGGQLTACAQACAWAIDELKASVPIWKKEVYEGGEVWKENAEARAALLAAGRGA